MFRQNLLVLSILIVGLTGCHHHHRHHPHAFRQPGLHGSRGHHHGHCRKCGRHSGRNNASYRSLFPGDVYGQFGHDVYGGGCGVEFIECHDCGSCPSSSACQTPPGNFCDSCSGFYGGMASTPDIACSDFGGPFNSPMASSVPSHACDCNRQQVPGIPRTLGPPQEALPPVPDNEYPSGDPGPGLQDEAAPPVEGAPSALPPIDPVSWKIPGLPPASPDIRY